MTHQQRIEFSIAKELMNNDDTLTLTCAIKAAGAVRVLIAKYSADAYNNGMISSIETPRKSLLDKAPPTTFKSWSTKNGLD